MYLKEIGWLCFIHLLVQCVRKFFLLYNLFRVFDLVIYISSKRFFLSIYIVRPVKFHWRDIFNDTPKISSSNVERYFFQTPHRGDWRGQNCAIDKHFRHHVLSTFQRFHATYRDNRCRHHRCINSLLPKSCSKSSTRPQNHSSRSLSAGVRRFRKSRGVHCTELGGRSHSLVG